MDKFDKVILGGSAIIPNHGPVQCDIGIKNGKISAIVDRIDSTEGNEIIDASDLIIFPGAVDCHAHIGIYRSIQEDARSETASSLVGGVTTLLSYFRTGQHYLNKTGSYKEIIPEVLQATEGNAYVDFGYHISPMNSDQVDEIEWMVKEAGISTFKFFMFYKGLNLSASSTGGKSFTMSDSYDLGHLYSVMEKVAKLNAEYGNKGILSVSVHCEHDEIIKQFIKRVKASGLDGLRAYHEARPSLSERIAIHEAGAIASSTGVNVNLLHLTSADALKASMELETIYPGIKVRREVTLHALGLTYDALEGQGMGPKVNPPIRTKQDAQALWDGVLKGQIDWIASDHACAPAKIKGDELWSAACGFGGTSLMYPFMISEGHHKRGVALERIAELLSTNPARAHACYPQKGSLMVGADADLALIDLEKEQTITTEILNSAQEYTPFEGMTLKGWPVQTILRGKTVYKDGHVVGDPQGEYLKRPIS